MQFTEIGFAVFLTLVFTVYWFVVNRSLKLQNLFLLAASYLFYGWWDWRFLGLIALTTVTTYVSALFSRTRYGRLLTTANIVLNVGILVLFKYLNFFAENLQRLFSAFGFNLDWFTIDVLLPVGISFYTFQAISYSVDAYKGKVEPCRDFVSFATFITYFPQLVAGPIERASQLLTQICRPRRWNEERAVRGLRMILFGVMKKVCVADMAGLYADRIFSGDLSDPLMCLAGGVLFSLQIYCDFSAYSEIARGVSALFGIELMANFRFPYFSKNVLDFWQRWHISLMLWFRDYVYIPLGGNRHGAVRTALNSLIVFLLSGLWHGAAWNFIIWGLYWGVVYMICKSLLGMKRSEGNPVATDFSSIALTFGVVVFGFYIFRCDSFSQIAAGFANAWIYLLCFGGLWLLGKVPVFCMKRVGRSVGKVIRYVLAAVIAAGFIAACMCLLPGWPVLFKGWWIVPLATVFAVEWRNRSCDYPMENVPRRVWARRTFYIVLMFMVLLSEPVDMSFIYFQF